MGDTIITAPPPQTGNIVKRFTAAAALALIAGLTACNPLHPSPFVPDYPSKTCQTYFVGPTPATYKIVKVCKP